MDEHQCTDGSSVSTCRDMQARKEIEKLYEIIDDLDERLERMKRYQQRRHHQLTSKFLLLDDENNSENNFDKKRDNSIEDIEDDQSASEIIDNNSIYQEDEDQEPGEINDKQQEPQKQQLNAMDDFLFDQLNIIKKLDTPNEKKMIHDTDLTIPAMVYAYIEHKSKKIGYLKYCSENTDILRYIADESQSTFNTMIDRDKIRSFVREYVANKPTTVIYRRVQEEIREIHRRYLRSLGSDNQL
ncbi:unnamed protein product [Didymodactylos carnosus]|uniref:Uncharacterized protein n=1 Tax=Didymodactylos carnosus TaxID=1234261 RepID=A0A813TGJ0_9BILA|nr:unnamed protein product [Didymodactylos carnosus]CAF1387276.1 unnamed protein product [Didymodactylos carnosus]CAF3600148.1 unnamed protein product [Didymodactylos carnosus]CAF4195109.1 unnamed protein product [Didymodactylos carnosus]